MAEDKHLITRSRITTGIRRRFCVFILVLVMGLSVLCFFFCYLGYAHMSNICF